MRISDWSSDVCSSDLVAGQRAEFLVNALDQLGCRGRAAISDRLERREVVFGPVRMLDQLPGDRRHPAGDIYLFARSEARRVGNECVSTFRSRLSPYTLKQYSNIVYSFFLSIFSIILIIY